MWKVEVEFTDFEREWIEYIARVRGISVSNAVRNFVEAGLHNRSESDILEFFGYDDGIGRTRAVDGKFADPSGELNSARIPDELLDVLKPGAFTYIRTLAKGVYSIKRIEIVTCNAFTVKYCVVSKNSSGKVIELKGDKAGERIVDEFGMPYVKKYALDLIKDVQAGNVSKYINCVWTDVKSLKNIKISDTRAASYLTFLLNNKRFTDQADINLLYYAYSVCKASANYKDSRLMRERKDSTFVTNIARAEEVMRWILENKKSNESRVSNTRTDKKEDLVDKFMRFSGDAVRKRINKNSKKKD